MKYKVHLWPIDKTIEAEAGETLLKACRRQGIEIKSKCGGVASCADCVARVIDGVDNLSPMEFEETKLLGNVFHMTKERLLCQLNVTGNISLDVSGHVENIREKENGPSKILVRKKADVKTKEEKWAARDEARAVAEKDRPARPKKLGGSKRPRGFNYSEDS